MASRRGRILQSLAAASSGRASDNGGQARRDDQLGPSPIDRHQATELVRIDLSTSGDRINPTCGSTRGRGCRILSQLAALSLRDSVTFQEPAPSDSSSLNGAGRGGPPSRQGSDLSRSSVVSQQFDNVDEISCRATLPKEPSSMGAQIQLTLNYLDFQVDGKTSIEEYHVDFNPNIESIRLRYKLLRTEAAKSVIGDVIHWTGTNLYLPIKLANSRTEFTAEHPVSGSPLQIKLVWVKTPPDSELLPFYNSLMHKVMTRLHYVIINRQHYSPMHRISIEQHKLELWPGWVTSIQRLDGGLKLIVDASFKVLRLETVYDILVNVRNRQQGMNLKEAFEEALVGKIIMTKYNNRAYRIDGIDLSMKPTNTFTMVRQGDREISYIDYMREHWNIEVRIPNQPMLVHRPKPKRGETNPATEVVYLIPELCVTTGLTDEMRANNFIMRDLISRTRLAPESRETKLLEFVNQISTDERAKTVLSDWSLSVKNSLNDVVGRRMENEAILTHNSRQIQVPDNVDWTRPVTNSQVFKTVDIERWVLMFKDTDEGMAREFYRQVGEVSRQLGIKFLAPRIVKLQDDSARSYVAASKREIKPTDQIAVILTPGRSQREDRYSACKRLFSCDLATPCQFIRCGTIDNERKIRSVVQKVVIQILSKVGGAPWAIKLPMKSFMIIGIDVYHDTIDRKKSCVGFVASMNEFTSSWWSRTIFQDSLEEIGQKLNSTVISAIRRFHAINGFIPERIIVYRDGVGDGQLETVIEVEVTQVMNAIQFYMRDCHGDDQSPHISYVVVQKRINTKMSLRERGSVKNPLPGSYLDHTITHPDYNDFFLISQHVGQGTVSPTKYIVLTETGNLRMPHHQKLAYKMTHMYYNWCGTISVPAPCQYAHKLAYLTGQNIKAQANERLEDRLYYL